MRRANRRHHADNHEYAAHRGTRRRSAACFEGRGYSVIKGNSESFRTDPQQ